MVIAEGTRGCSATCSSCRISAPGPQRHRSRSRPGRCSGEPVESRFEALHAPGLTALVGREKEIELLLRRGRAQDGRRPGRAALRRARHRQVATDRRAAGPACRRAARTAALFLLAAAHRQRALSGHRPDRTGRRVRARGHSQAKLDKLDSLLAQTATSAEDAALFAEMLSLPNDGRYPASRLTPQQRRQKTLEALVARSRHWHAQPGTDDLRGRALERSDEPEAARPRHRPARRSARAADRNVPAGVLGCHGSDSRT